MADDNGLAPWLTKREACEYLGVSDTWMSVRMERFRAGRPGGIPYAKYGPSRRSLVRFHIDDLDDYAESHRPVPPRRKRARAA
jgi:hypothetical protein